MNDTETASPAATKKRRAVRNLDSVYHPVSSPPPASGLRRRIGSAADVWADLFDLRAAAQEHFVVYDLNVRHRVLARRTVHIGTLTGVEAHPREIFRGAILNAAAAILLAHNHPSGDPSPSRQDLELTARLRQVGELCGIPILDHVVIAEQGFLSLGERGWV